MKYFIAGEKLLAFNAKCATSSFCWGIIKKYYPDILNMLVNETAYPAGKTAANSMHHRWVPKRHNPSLPVALVVREPVSRFLSAAAFMRINQNYTVDQIIDELYSEAGNVNVGQSRNLAANIHMLPQTRFYDAQDITYFRFSDQIDEAAAWLGLDTPLEIINEGSVEKPTLNASQVEKIQNYYAKDLELWRSLGGQDYSL